MFDNYKRNKAAREQHERRIGELERYARRPSIVAGAAEMLRNRILRTLPDQIRTLLRGEDVSPRTMPQLIDMLKRSLAELDFQQAAEARGRTAPRQLLRPEAYPEVPQAEAPRPERRRLAFGWRGDPDDPIYRGEMIKVQSSNVHSIGYQYNDASPSKGTLLVRYLQGTKQSKYAGPLYEYYDVHPAVFDSMRKASSKGKFVWDRLRVRGTVSGHRKQYKLAGISRGYVPRQAKRYGDNEYFVTRSVTGVNTAGEKRQFKSGLPDRPVRRVQSVQLLPGGRRVPLVQR